MDQKIITIVGMQGGAGRTTISLNLGYNLAEKREKKVLLIDLNPNQGMTRAILHDEKNVELKFSSNQLLSPDFDLPTNCGIFRKITDNLYLIPASPDLFENHPIQTPMILKNNIGTLKLANINKESDIPYFDIIVIDIPSQMSILTNIANNSAHGYFYVGIPDFYLNQSYSSFLNYAKFIEENRNSPFQCYGILLNNITRTKTSQEVIQQMKISHPKSVILSGMKRKEEIKKRLLSNKSGCFFVKSKSKEFAECNEYVDYIANIVLSN